MKPNWPPADEAHLKRYGPGSSDEEFEAYMFARKNPKGVHFERWRHAYRVASGFWRRGTRRRSRFPAHPAQSSGKQRIGKDRGETAGFEGNLNEHPFVKGWAVD